MLINSAADLGPEQLTSSEPLELSPALLERLRTTRQAVLSSLATGAPVYGVNTGMGALSKVRLSDAEQRTHQHNLLLARAAGGAPWLPPLEARAVLVARLKTFLTGDAGVSPELCLQLVALLNSGLVPAIPTGGAGSAGEIIPLAHASGPLVGIGSLLSPPPTTSTPPTESTTAGPLAGLTAAGSPAEPTTEGPLASPTTAVPTAGLAQPASRVGSSPSAHSARSAEWAVVSAEGVLPPFELGPKEGISLLAGIPGATGRAWLQVGMARRLVEKLTLVASGAIAVVGANRDPYNALCGRGDEVLAGELERIRHAAGAEDEPRGLQAPVSFRVVGPVNAQVRRAVGRLEEAVERAFSGVTDSPAFLDGEFVGTAGFHGIDLAAHCDQLVAALAHAAEVSTARIHRLLDPAVTGLPAQLAAEPGPQAGLVTVHKRAVATSHYLRRLAMPSAVGAMETSNGQEDVQSFSWEAVGVLGEAIRLTREVVACELLAVHQAFALSERPVPEGLQGLLDEVADVVPPIVADRPFGVDLARLLEYIV
ncbi:aromatic amino acid lyase [Kribbella sp. NPDC051620]|uniref:aromatic amino acid lyase n=1 Tax=Kribbella sp. NPDC051620 TaxID=3364120 RepID=UPI0037A9CC4D